MKKLVVSAMMFRTSLGHARFLQSLTTRTTTGESLTMNRNDEVVGNTTIVTTDFLIDGAHNGTSKIVTFVDGTETSVVWQGAVPDGNTGGEGNQDGSSNASGSEGGDEVQEESSNVPIVAGAVAVGLVLVALLALFFHKRSKRNSFDKEDTNLSSFNIAPTVQMQGVPRNPPPNNVRQQHQQQQQQQKQKQQQHHPQQLRQQQPQRQQQQRPQHPQQLRQQQQKQQQKQQPQQELRQQLQRPQNQQPQHPDYSSHQPSDQYYSQIDNDSANYDDSGYAASDIGSDYREDSTASSYYDDAGYAASDIGSDYREDSTASSYYDDAGYAASDIGSDYREDSTASSYYDDAGYAASDVGTARENSFTSDSSRGYSEYSASSDASSAYSGYSDTSDGFVRNNLSEYSDNSADYIKIEEQPQVEGNALDWGNERSSYAESIIVKKATSVPPKEWNESEEYEL